MIRAEVVATVRRSGPIPSGFHVDVETAGLGEMPDAWISLHFESAEAAAREGLTPGAKVKIAFTVSPVKDDTTQKVTKPMWVWKRESTDEVVYAHMGWTAQKDALVLPYEHAYAGQPFIGNTKDLVLTQIPHVFTFR